MPQQNEEKKIDIADPTVRSKLFQAFAPKFLFHAQEKNFPVDPDQMVQEIITVKKNTYSSMKQLNHDEQEELNFINRFFWDQEKNRFASDYIKHFNDPDFIKPLADSDNKFMRHFLIFDEKHYGYQVGEKIDVAGIYPKGHKQYDPNKRSAPTIVSIIPTDTGFFIQYQLMYALNNAIRGTQWLRRILPESWCNLFNNFGFHYGDCEGVGIHVKYEGNRLVFESMQTFAHGSKGARNVPATDCHFDENNKVCVYVGIGGHPSYANPFLVNQFMDQVGAAYSIEPSNFIDVSADIFEKEKINLLNPQYQKTIPPSLMVFSRFADSNPLAHDGPKDLNEIKDLANTHNKYKPFLFFTNLWRWLVRLFKSPQPKIVPSRNISSLSEISPSGSSPSSNTTVLQVLLSSPASSPLPYLTTEIANAPISSPPAQPLSAKPADAADALPQLNISNSRQ